MRGFIFAMIVFVIGSAAWAQPGPYSGTPGYGPGFQGQRASAGDDPHALVHQAVSTLVNYVREGGTKDRSRVIGYVDREVSSYIDFDSMTRAAAGPLYHKLTEQQKDHISSQIKDHFLATLVAGLMSHRNETIRILPARISRPGRSATVTAWVNRRGARSTRLDFRFYPGKDGWKVFDVSANGSSATAFYRGMVRQMMAQHGRRFGR